MQDVILKFQMYWGLVTLGSGIIVGHITENMSHSGACYLSNYNLKF